MQSFCGLLLGKKLAKINNRQRRLDPTQEIYFYGSGFLLKMAYISHSYTFTCSSHTFYSPGKVSLTATSLPSKSPTQIS